MKVCTPTKSNSTVQCDYMPLCYILAGELECTLSDILIFSSRYDKIPPIGFTETPTLTFLYSESSPLPTASTCDITLRLPTTHMEYGQFKQYMLLGIQGIDGFGGA